MLLCLKVKNYALISDVEIEFTKGMNIITGETGAGKSILIGALGLVLGNRADISALRNKESKCVIEADFDISSYNLKTFFNENDLDFDDKTCLRREISSSGKSRMFINGTPVNLKVLGKLGDQLIEIHSQHDNLQLFQKSFQFRSLDALAGGLEIHNQYQQAFGSYLSLKKDLEHLQSEQVQLKNEQEFKQFQFTELDDANLDGLDEESLNREMQLLENAESLLQVFNGTDAMLNNSEFASIAQLQGLKQTLSKVDTDITQELSERLNSVIIELQDISSEVDNAASSVEINPHRLEEVNEAMATIFNLKAKHQVQTLDQLIERKANLEQELQLSSDLDLQIVEKSKQVSEMYNCALNLAKKLGKNRQKGVERVQQALDTGLAEVGMEHSRIRYSLTDNLDLGTYGLDNLEIELSSDKGNSFNPLKKSASGGELSRINLCLKKELSSKMAMPTSILDEIDTGVSGEVARKVGLLMRETSSTQQVIVITHLPQIASLGQSHLYVFKQSFDGGVETKVRTLLGDDRINEIAKMISGDNLTEHAVEQSKALLNP